MRIKFNAAAIEIEVLDAKGDRVYYVKTENTEFDADVDKLIAEFTCLAESFE